MTSLLATLVISSGLVAACFFLHFAVLKRLARLVHHHERPVRRPLLLVVFSLFGAHLVETMLYALAYALIERTGLGYLSGAVGTGPAWLADHLYFSIASYTTLGIGDIAPEGSMRLVAGVESLNGLVLVAWSASFTYLIMERVWGPLPARD